MNTTSTRSSFFFCIFIGCSSNSFKGAYRHLLCGAAAQSQQKPIKRRNSDRRSWRQTLNCAWAGVTHRFDDTTETKGFYQGVTRDIVCLSEEKKKTFITTAINNMRVECIQVCRTWENRTEINLRRPAENNRTDVLLYQQSRLIRCRLNRLKINASSCRKWKLSASPGRNKVLRSHVIPESTGGEEPGVQEVTDRTCSSTGHTCTWTHLQPVQQLWGQQQVDLHRWTLLHTPPH